MSAVRSSRRGERLANLVGTQADARPAEWLTARRFALLLGLLVFSTFPGATLGIQTFIFRDFGLFSYPVAAFHRQCFWRGELPLWNPYNHCGVPFLAQWNTLALYPPSLIYLLFPLAWSLSFFCLLHLFWGGLGMFFLARQWTRHSLGAAFAGIIFAFNGLSQSFLIWPTHIATFAWLPWVVWLTQAAWRTGGRNLVWATLAGALQMLAGGPETILLTWLFLAALALGDCLSKQMTPRLVLLRFGGLALLVALLSAAQLLPFLQLLAHAQRDSGFGASGWSMPRYGWANFLVPLFQTRPTSQGVFMQIGQYWTTSYYAGIGTVFLAIVAIRRGCDWRVWFLAGLVLVCLLLALGENALLYPTLRSWFPALGFMRYPVKFVILVLALAPLLAAFGLQELSMKARALGWFEVCPGLVLLLFIGAIVWLDLRGFAWDWGIVWQKGLSRMCFLTLFVILSALLVKATGPRRVVCGSILLLVVWGDLVTYAPHQNPTVAPAVYAAGLPGARIPWSPAPILGKGRAMVSPAAQAALKYISIPRLEQNYLLDRLGLLADCNLLDNIPQAQGFFSLTPAPINDATLVPYVQTNLGFSPLLDFMGVCQITAPGKAFDWAARPSAMPLVTAGQAPVFATDQAVFATFSQPDTDFRKVVFLPPEAKRIITAGLQSEAHVLAARFANQAVAIQTETPASSLLVISQTWYPAWKAFVDGQPTRLWRANFAFQALEVPAGRHTVRLVYEDNAFRAGLVLSGLGLGACLCLWLRIPFRNYFSAFSRQPIAAAPDCPMTDYASH